MSSKPGAPVPRTSSTPNRELARAFSHKPSLVSIRDDGSIRHNGKRPGYLYVICEKVRPGDVEPVSRSTMGPGQEWSIKRPLKVALATHTEVRPPSPSLPYIEQAISCLVGYRDDAHLAAWQPSGLSATALETLTFLWRGEADSLDTVCERLAHRGHPRRVYAEALAELRERGFIEGSEDAPRLTEAGRAFRDRVEADTDRYFFAPWVCLDDAEKVELADLLTRLRDGLRGEWREMSSKKYAYCTF